VLAVIAPDAAVAGTPIPGQNDHTTTMRNETAKIYYETEKIEDTRGVLCYTDEGVPGKVKSPVKRSPSSGVLCPGSVCFPASALGLHS
jgi:hypothetical protein